jgi:OmpA-OmpF porin, OOP family
MQGILGASFPVPAVPGLSLTAEYRYFVLPSNRSFSGNASFAPDAVAPGSPASTEPANVRLTNATTHSLLLGLRYAFNVAPPAAPPAPMPVAAPAPALSRTYLVFFDWDRADLTDRARQIIKEAADASTRVKYTQIKVDGYTDLSGSAAYNQRLSVRRAESVAGELVRDGVPRTAIGVQGFGESNPLVPTAQGVREPQNRRVEIIFQ